MKTIEHSLPHIKGLILQYDQADTMVNALLRISEYSSRNEYGKIFLVEEYANDRGIELTDLYSNVHGIMVLDSYINSFIQGYGYHNMSEAEKELVGYLRNMGWLNEQYVSTGPFYLIAINPEAPRDMWQGIVEHEASHVAYKTSDEYREKTKQAYHALSYDQRRSVLRELLEVRDYSRDLLYNEFQAHLFHGFNEKHRKWLGAESIIQNLENIILTEKAA